MFLDYAPLGVGGDQRREHIKANGVVTSLDQAVEHRVPVLEFPGWIMAQQPGEIPHGDGGWPLEPADAVAIFGGAARPVKAAPAPSPRSAVPAVCFRNWRRLVMSMRLDGGKVLRLCRARRRGGE